MSDNFFVAIILPVIAALAVAISSIVFLPIWAAVIVVLVVVPVGFLIVIFNCLPPYRG